MNKRTIAIFYQSKAPPAIDGIKKPQKPGGYSDSGADIAFALTQAGEEVLTPLANPDPANAMDWVFPDSDAGLGQAFLAGANLFWMNTVLFAGHAVDRIRSNDLWIVGQDAEATQRHDDKFFTNTMLREEGLTVAQSCVIEGTSPKLPAAFAYPVILKPIRGRGSAGVTLVKSEEEFASLIAAWMKSDEYGTSFMLEELLPGEEITITVMPAGTFTIHGEELVKPRCWALPAVKRFNHIDFVAPYNGTVAVVHNSSVLSEAELKDPDLIRITEACEKAADLIGSKAVMRIDCRQDSKGFYKIFDVNMKPNMTGAGRPGREDQDSLSALAARAIAWSYTDLLQNIIQNAWASK